MEVILICAVMKAGSARVDLAALVDLQTSRASNAQLPLPSRPDERNVVAYLHCLNRQEGASHTLDWIVNPVSSHRPMTQWPAWIPLVKGHMPVTR